MNDLNNKKVNLEHRDTIKKFLEVVNNKKNTFARAYPSIMAINCDSTLKLLVILMIDDARLNKGWVKWAHNTYADKLGRKRNTILKHFKNLEELGILLPSAENKVGGRKNKHVLDLLKFIRHYSVPPSNR